jgi:hypothetical protein
MKLVIMQFSVSYYFIPLEFQVFSSAPCFQMPMSMFSCKYWGPSLTPYHTRGKTVVLHILIFTFLHKLKISELNGCKHYHNFICS